MNAFSRKVTVKALSDASPVRRDGERRDGQRLRTGRIRYELGLGTPAFEERSESRPKDRETKARPVQAALTSSNFKWSRIRPTRS